MKFLLLILANFIFLSFGTKDVRTIGPHLYEEKDLFDSDEVLSIKLKGNIRELLNDRATKSTYRSVTLSYFGKDSNETSIPVEMKTRGHFRKIKGNCKYPPLQISFPADVNRLSPLFSGQKK